MNYFEEIEVGTRRVLGSHTFTAADIKRFAAAFDPQPFHVDEAAAECSHFGGLVASGWHTASGWMKLNVLALQRWTEELRAAGVPIATKGPSPGFEALAWPNPVHAGDTVTFEREIAAKRPSRSRPGWGLVTFQNTGRNQRGEVVLSFRAHNFIERRVPEPLGTDDVQTADQ